MDHDPNVEIPEVDLTNVNLETETKPEKNDLGPYKTPEDLAKGYKEIQGYATKVSQEKKELEKQLEAMRNEFASLKEQMEFRQEPVQPQMPNDPDFETRLLENPNETIAQLVSQQVATQRIAETLEEIQETDPETFNERYGYVSMLAQNPQYQPYLKTAKGVKRLFKIADEQLENRLKNQAMKSITTLFGENADLDKLKQLIASDKKDQGAYMPDLGAGGPPRDVKPDHGKKIKDAVDRGDPEAEALKE